MIRLATSLVTAGAALAAALSLLVGATQAQAATSPVVATAAAMGSPPGIVRGRIVNATAGALGAPGATVTAVPMAALDGGPGDPVTVTVGADGVFSIAGLPVAGGVGYGVVATYFGVPFVHPEVITLTTGSPVRDGLSVSVYEPDPDVPLTVRTAHVVLVPEPTVAALHAAEVWVLRNDTDRAWVARPGAAALRLELPPGAYGVAAGESRDPSTVVREGDDVLDVRPVPPGERQVVVTYEVPYTGTQLTWRRELVRATDELRLMIASPDAAIESDALTETERSEMGGQPLMRAAGHGLAAGTVVRALVRGLPPPSAVAQDALVELPRPFPGPRELSGLALGFSLTGTGLAVACAWRRRRERKALAASTMADGGRTPRGSRGLDGRMGSDTIAANASDAHRTVRARAGPGDGTPLVESGDGGPEAV